MNRVIEYCLLLCLILLSGGCEAPTQDAATTTGGIEVRLIWPSAAEWQSAAPRKLAQPRSNMPDQVQTVRFRVTAPDMTTMQKDFPAADRRGEISGVPSGSNRKLTVQALAADGALLADCVKAGLLVEPGKTTQTGDCIFQVVGGGATTKAIEPEMVSIASGCFDMGSPDTEEGRDSYETLHNVCVGAFKMGKYEVTFAEYDRYVEATGADRPGDSGWGRGQRPVINVSWLDATAYAEWLSRETGKSYRLPTEAEWEYAARAGTTTPFHFGNTITTDQANYDGNYTYNGGPKGVYREKTLEVGSFEANAWGLYDVHGNAWEWTCSKWVTDYDGSESKCSSKNDASSSRVLRGGSWFNAPRNLRSANRGGNSPGNRIYVNGFRMAQDL